MKAGDIDAGPNLSPERKKLFAGLNTLHETISENMHEFSRLMKEAEASAWAEEPTRRADAVFDSGVRLNHEYSALLNQLESGLTKEEKSHLDAMEEESKFRIEEPARFLKKDLAPDQIPADQVITIEDSLAKDLDHLLSHVPPEWLREQRSLLTAAGDSYLRQPLILAAGMVDMRHEPVIHPYAHALLMAEDSLAKKDIYDMYQGALLVPCISALCEHLDGVHDVKRGVPKLEELPRSAPEETLSRIFELLVAGRGAEMGRSIELLEPTSAKTPDLRIHDLPFPAVAECKKQSRLSASERKEMAWIRDLFHRLARERLEIGLVGELEIELTKTIEAVPVETIRDAVVTCTGGLNPYSKKEHAWGSVSLSPLDIEIDLPSETRLYSPFFLKTVFDWDSQNSEYDGICAVVKNDSSVRVGRAELPFCLKWRINAQESIERKARNVVSALAEAISQVPVGEGSFVYISYDDSRRAAIADRRTEKVIEVAKTFQVRKRGTRPPLMIVINRLYPAALQEGRPDMVESAIPMSLDEDPYWPKIMPTRVFV